MKIQFENVDFNSRSGPNGFGLKLARQFVRCGHELTNTTPDVRLAFIQSVNDFEPTVLRLDGIYFNTAQDWERMNEPIKRSYDHATHIIVQSEFDKQLVFKFFGERKHVHVIHNGTDVGLINDVPAQLNPKVHPRETIWMCASSWRPHKRLDENIRLFQTLRNVHDQLIVAGKNANVSNGVDTSHVHFVGDLSWETMISWMKSAGHFVHLSWLDHCPNVIVDAKAAGCKLHVSEAGGTAELVSEMDCVYSDGHFNFEPIELSNPPVMQFKKSLNTSNINHKIDMQCCSEMYLKVMEDVRQ